MKINRTDILVAACHSAWYCYTVLALGEPGEPFATAPRHQMTSLIDGIDFWDQKIKDLKLEGKAENDIIRILAPLSHMNWVDYKLSQGWTYGPSKDVEAKTHPCIVDYDKLSESNKKKDEVVLRAYLAIRRAMGELI